MESSQVAASRDIHVSNTIPSDCLKWKQVYVILLHPFQLPPEDNFTMSFGGIGASNPPPPLTEPSFRASDDLRKGRRVSRTLTESGARLDPNHSSNSARENAPSNHTAIGAEPHHAKTEASYHTRQPQDVLSHAQRRYLERQGLTPDAQATPPSSRGVSPAPPQSTATPQMATTLRDDWQAADAQTQIPQRPGQSGGDRSASAISHCTQGVQCQHRAALQVERSRTARLVAANETLLETQDYMNQKCQSLSDEVTRLRVELAEMHRENTQFGGQRGGPNGVANPTKISEADIVEAFSASPGSKLLEKWRTEATRTAGPSNAQLVIDSLEADLNQSLKDRRLLLTQVHVMQTTLEQLTDMNERLMRYLSSKDPDAHTHFLQEQRAALRGAHTREEPVDIPLSPSPFSRQRRSLSAERSGSGTSSVAARPTSSMTPWGAATNTHATNPSLLMADDPEYSRGGHRGWDTHPSGRQDTAPPPMSQPRTPSAPMPLAQTADHSPIRGFDDQHDMTAQDKSEHRIPSRSTSHLAQPTTPRRVPASIEKLLNGVQTPQTANHYRLVTGATSGSGRNSTPHRYHPPSSGNEGGASSPTHSRRHADPLSDRVAPTLGFSLPRESLDDVPEEQRPAVIQQLLAASGVGRKADGSPVRVRSASEVPSFSQRGVDGDTPGAAPFTHGPARRSGTPNRSGGGDQNPLRGGKSPRREGRPPTPTNSSTSSTFPEQRRMPQLPGDRERLQAERLGDATTTITTERVTFLRIPGREVYLEMLIKDAAGINKRNQNSHPKRALAFIWRKLYEDRRSRRSLEEI